MPYFRGLSGLNLIPASEEAEIKVPSISNYWRINEKGSAFSILEPNLFINLP